MQKSSQKSFTLLELLVVIAIIAILAGVVIASVVDLRQRTKESKGMQFSQNIRTTLSNELVGEWKFDNLTTPYIDTSDEGINGTPYNNPQQTDDAKVGKALLVNGQRVDMIDVNCKQKLLYSEFTIEAWARASTLGTWNGLLTSKRAAADGFNLQMGTAQNIAMLIGNGTTYTYIKTDWAPSIKTWYHIIATHRSNNLNELYVNGNKEKEGSFAIGYASSFTNNTCVCIGCFYLGGASFNGIIDEVRIYKSALTAKQIKQLYAEGKIRHLVNK
ncbi:MAG: prepilin-type N-terminal cleavage/methylation domain-containing protein [Candidatus Pacebacteria bacterium]|nr:prepilin-type N-terminal cleavage/methylation domain-containing protein [Candidatus Paceibacterota bacterium]